MAEWRRLTSADVTEILEAFGVGGYQAHQPIAAGTINTNVRVTTAGGPLFLRINEGKTRDDVQLEADIVSWMAARGVPTPEPYRTPAGAPFAAWSGELASLFPWVPGRTLARGELTPGHGAAVGRALAQLHKAGADNPDRREGRYTPDEIDRRLEAIAALGRPELAEAVATLAPELKALAAERNPALPCGIIHGDLFVDNVLFHEDGRLSALLDFEQASYGRLAYDVAVTLLAFGFGADDFRPDVTRAFLEAYAAVRRPTREERAGFGAELRFAACRFAVTRITDVHLKRGTGAPGGKRFQRYLARLARVRQHAGQDLLALPATSGPC
ncbi:MAG TPA: homoserine kinase [Polyangia bacterium]|nr:homoserine kinase [Polyangia bacterium]